VNTDVRQLLRWVLILSITLVLQVGLFNDVRFWGVHPDLLLLLAVCAGLTGGPGRGAGVGFACGLLLDLFLPGRFGVTALAYALTGYGAGVAGDTVVRPARWISVGLVVLSSAAGTLLYAAIGQLLGQRSLSDPRLAAIVGIVSVVNGVLALPALAVCRWADHDPLRARLR
jgi:rod shape-determining protein MreD